MAFMTQHTDEMNIELLESSLIYKIQFSTRICHVTVAVYTRLGLEFPEIFISLP